jgi:hypothetical protein
MIVMRVLIVLIALATEVVAQQDSVTNDIRTTPKFNFGIFENFSDFKQNKPSITTGFKIRIDSGSAFVRYFLIDYRGKRIKKVYGFSDGKALFINAQIYGQPAYFVPILMRGEIFYFEDEVGRASAISANSGIYTFGLAGALVSTLIVDAVAKQEADRNPGWIIFFPDGDGQAYLLSKQSMKSILKESHPELLAQFSSEPFKNEYTTLLRYLIRYNEIAKSKQSSP